MPAAPTFSRRLQEAGICQAPPKECKAQTSLRASATSAKCSFERRKWSFGKAGAVINFFADWATGTTGTGRHCTLSAMPKKPTNQNLNVGFATSVAAASCILLAGKEAELSREGEALVLSCRQFIQFLE